MYIFQSLTPSVLIGKTENCLSADALTSKPIPGARLRLSPFFIARHFLIFVGQSFLVYTSERKTFHVVIYQDKIRAACERLDISAETLAALVGISPASLSRFMTKNANLPELSVLMETISDLDALVSDAAPYSLPFDDVAATKKMIERFRAGLRFIPVAVGPQEEIADFEVEEKQ